MADRTYPTGASPIELQLLQEHPPLTEVEENRLVDTPDGYLIKIFPKQPRAWLRVYKRLLRTERADRTVAVSLDEMQRRREGRLQKAAYAESLRRIDELEQQIEVLAGLDDLPSALLTSPAKPTGAREAALIFTLSDWHAAEEIRGDAVNGLNRYDLDVCHQRVSTLGENIVRLYKHEKRASNITTVVLAMLGDLCNGELRQESVATNLLGPIDEVYFVQQRLTSLIDKVIDAVGPKVRVVIPVCYGNHSRLTPKLEYKRIRATSTEYILGLNLHAQYHDHADVVLSDGSQLVLPLAGHNVRFHHGNAWRFIGGIHGVDTPARRTILQWNSATPCLLDVFGHWHTYGAPSDMLMSGALCGYNEFALGRGFRYSPPGQAATLIDSLYGRRGSWPIRVE